MFSQETYTTRRSRLSSQLGSGLVLLTGHSESPRNFADNVYKFRQDSTFLYFCGLNQPDLAAIIDLDQDQTVIYGDELTLDHIVWMGDLPTIAQRAAQVGVSETRPLDQIAGDLAQAKAAGRTLHFLPPYRPQNMIKMSPWLGLEPTAIADQASEELIKAVVEQRSVKTGEEIVEIEKAVNISVDMHVAAMKMARPGMLEAEIAAEVERVAAASGGSISFQPIATINGQILHNHDHSNVLKPGDLFLLDAGAETTTGYAGDLSSTFPVDATFTPRQRTIYDLALQAHQAAVEKLAPGTPNLEVHLAAARVITQGMKDLGIMRGDVEEAIAAGAHAMFFPCGVGHMMGLDVHDMEDLGEVWVGYDGQPKSTQFGLKSLRLARALEAGFVLTVEPGIYFIPQLIDQWRNQSKHLDFFDYEELNKWRDLGGIRNEEDYLITEQGHRLLGKAKPMTAAEVEALRS